MTRFPALYFKKIPKNYLPTEHHRIVHPLLGYFKVFFFTLLVALLGDYTVLVAVLVIIMNAAEIIYCWHYEIYQDTLYFKFAISESLMISLLFLIKLILSQISGIISTNGYLSFGYIYMSIAIVVILNGFARSGYLILDYIRKNRSHEEVQHLTMRS